jgi:hypothetical protein
MIRTKLFLACALAFAVSLVGTTASAQEPVNQITYFTFSAPFELPGGKTLPAGKYVFKIVDSPSNRHVVQVMSEDQTEMHATLMAIPAQRMEPAEEPEVRFMEAEASAAPAIRTWWYPGRSIGHEFIYPKDHARRLAARQSEGVLTTAGDATGDEAMRSGDLARIGADGRETAYNANENAEAQNAENNRNNQTTSTGAVTEQSAAGQPSTPAETTSATGQQAATAAQTARSAEAPAQSATPEQPTAAQTTQPEARREAAAPQASAETTARDESTRTTLPRTASLLPLIGLLGLGSLLGAGALRFRR